MVFGADDSDGEPDPCGHDVRVQDKRRKDERQHISHKRLNRVAVEGSQTNRCLELVVNLVQPCISPLVQQAMNVVKQNLVDRTENDDLANNLEEGGQVGGYTEANPALSKITDEQEARDDHKERIPEQDVRHFGQQLRQGLLVLALNVPRKRQHHQQANSRVPNCAT